MASVVWPDFDFTKPTSAAPTLPLPVPAGPRWHAHSGLQHTAGVSGIFLLDAAFRIVLDLLGEFAERGHLVFHLHAHIEHVDDHRGKGIYSRITEAVSQVVQPRFEAPVSVKFLIPSDHSFPANSCTASMPRTALFTIGNNSGQVPSRC